MNNGSTKNGLNYLGEMLNLSTWFVDVHLCSDSNAWTLIRISLVSSCPIRGITFNNNFLLTRLPFLHMIYKHSYNISDLLHEYHYLLLRISCWINERKTNKQTSEIVQYASISKYKQDKNNNKNKLNKVTTALDAKIHFVKNLYYAH